MIKLIGVGVWACIVTLGASYLTVSWQSARATPPPAHAPTTAIETIKTRMISVPIIRDGALQGYVVAQFSFTVDSKTLKTAVLKPDLVLVDEAFKEIYGEDNLDFRKLQKQDLAGLSKRIVEGANKRLGARMIEDAFLQELNYISKDRARSGKAG